MSLNTFWNCSFSEKTCIRLGSRSFSENLLQVYVYKVLNCIQTLNFYLKKTLRIHSNGNIFFSALTLNKNNPSGWSLDFLFKVLGHLDVVRFFLIFVFSRKKAIRFMSSCSSFGQQHIYFRLDTVTTSTVVQSFCPDLYFSSLGGP